MDRFAGVGLRKFCIDRDYDHAIYCHGESYL